MKTLLSFLVVATIEDLGERKAINLISEFLTRGSEAIGIGDDCAAFKLNDDYLLISTDMICEKTHIPDKMTPWEIGWFIVAINLSDIAAKGGKPLGIVLSLGLPKKTSEDFLKKLMKGADECATEYNCSIVGGDTKENSNFTIAGTAFGLVDKKLFMSRRGAEIGDIIAVTGDLGKAGAGYYSLKNNLKNKKLQLGLTKPYTRIKEGKILSETGMINCCMDISDGLSSSLYQLKDINKVGFKIYRNQIPVSDTAKFLSDRKDFDLDFNVLHFGGDYELLLTLNPENFEKVKEKIEKNNSSLTKIGVVTQQKKIIIEDKNTQILENKGFEHFK
ncbi:MAG: thiamine-phosphate kinase [Candidatus Thermoplasmatota archaeon]